MAVIPSRLRRESHRFYIGANEISGIQNVDASYSIGRNPVKYLNYSPNYRVEIPQGQQIGNLSVNSLLLLNYDPFIEFTGNRGINAYLVKSKNNQLSELFTFQSGYLTTYSQSCSIGQVPEIAATFVVTNDIGRMNSEEVDNFISALPVQGGCYRADTTILTADLTTITADYDLSCSAATGDFLPIRYGIPAFQSINLNVDDFETNRVISYDLSINCNRNIIYKNNSRVPAHVKLNEPLEININFTIQNNDYPYSSLFDYPCNSKSQDITLEVNDYLSNENIVRYNFQNMTLLGESYGIDVNGNATSTISYRGFIGNSVPNTGQA